MDDLEAFGGFVDAAAGLEASPCVDLEPFALFARDARSLLLGEVMADLGALRSAAEVVARWSSPHDLLFEARMRGWEDPITELIRWALHPNTHPASALARQHVCLRAFGWEGELPTETVEPRTQYRTDAGAFIDLVLDYAERAVVVEAKWYSDEHEAGQTGELQTIHYADAARRELRRPGEPLVVYLTPNGRSPKAEGTARPVMHAAVAFALASALDPHHLLLDEDLRTAFRIVLGHLFRWDGAADLTGLGSAINKVSGGVDFSIADLDTVLAAQRFFRQAPKESRA